MNVPTKEQVDRFVAHVAATRGPWYDASRRELHAFAVLSELGEYLEAIELGQPRELVMLEAGDVLFHAVTLLPFSLHVDIFNPSSRIATKPSLVSILRGADLVKKELARGGDIFDTELVWWLYCVVAFMDRDDWPEVMALHERKKEVKAAHAHR
jgi:hypothetical protein